MMLQPSREYMKTTGKVYTSGLMIIRRSAVNETPKGHLNTKPIYYKKLNRGELTTS